MMQTTPGSFFAAEISMDSIIAEGCSVRKMAPNNIPGNTISWP